jgi:hypothetical protein
MELSGTAFSWHSQGEGEGEEEKEGGKKDLTDCAHVL